MVLCLRIHQEYACLRVHVPIPADWMVQTNNQNYQTLICLHKLNQTVCMAAIMQPYRFYGVISVYLQMESKKNKKNVNISFYFLIKICIYTPVVPTHAFSSRFVHFLHSTPSIDAECSFV